MRVGVGESDRVNRAFVALCTGASPKTFGSAAIDPHLVGAGRFGGARAYGECGRRADGGGRGVREMSRCMTDCPAEAGIAGSDGGFRRSDLTWTMRSMRRTDCPGVYSLMRLFDAEAAMSWAQHYVLAGV